MDELLRTLMGGTDRPQGGADEAPLGNLLAGLLHKAGDEQASGSDLLGGMLAALRGGGSGGGANDVAGLAEQAQVTPTVVHAVLALLASQLAGQGTARAAGVDLNALMAQAGAGAELDEATLKASGLPQELTRATGLDLSAAIKALQRLLPLLAGIFKLPGLRPAAKPKPSAATSSSAAKPKPTSSTARPKPAASAGKPKPTSGTSKPKPTTKPRPRKSEGLNEINLDEPTDTDA